MLCVNQSCQPSAGSNNSKKIWTYKICLIFPKFHFTEVPKATAETLAWNPEDSLLAETVTPCGSVTLTLSVHHHGNNQNCLFCFLGLNRSQRLLFDVSSPNGILLFRETSKMITTYGTDFPLILRHQVWGKKKKLEFFIWTSLWFLLWHAGNRILTLGEVPKDQVYGVKLKGVSVCFTMLKAVLSGNYVNFGVFRLYGDDALDNALQTFIKLLLSIPHSDLLVRLNSDCEALCDGRRLLDVCLCVCRCRITPSSASPFTLCWRCWHRTTWTSSPAWSPKSWCTSCRRYPKGSPRSVITAHKSSRWEGRSVVALTCCVCLCVCCRYDGMHRLLFQSGPHSHLPV